MEENSRQVSNSNPAHQMDCSNEFGGSSTPGSPAATRSRLGKVTRLISRSDANLSTTRGRRSRHDSGGSVRQASPSPTPPDGSPSRRFMTKASGYMTHLKSRISKHRDKSREKEPHSQQTYQSFSACCGHPRSEESSDTLAGASIGGEPLGEIPCRGDGVRSSIEGGTTTSEGSCSASVNVNSYTSESISSSTLTHNTQSGLLDRNRVEEMPSIQTSSAKPGGTNPTPPHPFYTLNVHLQRGKNLVARDSCELPTPAEDIDPEIVTEPPPCMTVPFKLIGLKASFGFRHTLLRPTKPKTSYYGSSDPYVKVKIGDKLHYKSKTIYRDLNPVWDESFVLPINDISQPIVFKVFDYDWGFQDDFMGMTLLDVARLPHHKSTDMTLTLSETSSTGEIPMGELCLNLTLVPRSIEEKEILSHFLTPKTPTSLREKIESSKKWLTDGQASTRLADTQRRLKSQIWSSVLTVLILEAKHLCATGEEPVLVDAFTKFRLGNQKYKSRTVARSATPKWIEQFDFYLYEGQPQMLEVQVFDESGPKDHIGRCSIDIGLLDKETTHHVTYPLQEGTGEISLLLTISGTCGSETISDLTSHSPSTEEGDLLHSKYALSRSLHQLKDVGHLTVKVYEAQGLVAADIGGKSDPFCVLELINARLQTQTEYRTLTPCWNKIFTFAVKDITSVLDVTVYDEDRHHKTEFLGKIAIPLWKIKNGEKKWYILKDKRLLHAARGSNPQILLEFNLIWNPIRAGIRVMDPPEPKFLLPDQRLKREVFLLNIDRLRKIGVAIYDVMQYTQSCMEWEYPVRSIIALLLYQILCYTFQPFMIPLILMLLILKHWLVSSVTGVPLVDDFPEDGETIGLDEEDDGDDDGDEKKMSLRQKLQAVQDATQTLQNALGDIASICESTRNMFRMVVPFISWLAVLGLFIGTVVLYLIPVRYLAMAWGMHKFLKPLLRPHAIPTNEVYNLLQRVPDNQDLIYHKLLRPSASQEIQRSQKSPPTKSPQPKKKYKFW